MHRHGKKYLATNFRFEQKSEKLDIRKFNKLNPFSANGLREVARMVKDLPKIDLIFYANPSFFEYVFIAFLKVFTWKRVKIALFDLILKYPGSTRLETYIAFVKGFFLRRFDCIFVIHRDTTGYEEHYGLRREKFHYIPFKANNYFRRDDYEIKDEGFVLSLGGSQRDYETLCQAAEGQDWPVVIVCRDDSRARHNALLPHRFPGNVKHISDFVDAEHWNRLLSSCTLVVVPIREEAIQPAGISVYLEAMIYRKACIVTKGASSVGIIDRNNRAIQVPPRDSEALREAIESLWRDPALRQQYADAGHSYATGLKDDNRMRSDILNALESLG
ncbi:glycosyltransferase [Exilibacterium tricleocarpae]|uniref:Glycosyltransferase n=1 Tax=Exilibacterium tricleocarpae TaxID=2591008 RepID=A0A545T3F9_9GAMM|nr:glycosyltransferase [Exilibacterium tricleocarpae]TQV71754.1 glycosyltransferase [Exilibacterium tricleocarpae]